MIFKGTIKEIYYYLWLKKYMDNEKYIVKRLLSEGDVALIVGASYGMFTRCCSECVGDTGRVLSFEPVKETFHILASNVEKYNLMNVELFNYAIWDKQGAVKMTVPKFGKGFFWFFLKNYYTASISDEGNILVRTIRLDDLYPLVEKDGVDFIKVDGNLTKYPAMRGAKQLIAKYEPAMLLEAGPDTHKPVFDLLYSWGYDAYRINEDKLVKYKEGDKRHGANCFFLKEKHIKKMNAAGIIQQE